MTNDGWRMTKGQVLEMRSCAFVSYPPSFPSSFPAEARRASTTVAVGGAKRNPRIARATEAPRMRRDNHGEKNTAAGANIG